MMVSFSHLVFRPSAIRIVFVERDCGVVADVTYENRSATFNSVSYLKAEVEVAGVLVGTMQIGDY